MQKFLKYTALVLTLLFALNYVVSHRFEYEQEARNNARRNEPISLQQKATHMIVLFEYEKRYGLCTGTAIGPHALLTATHCTDKGKVESVQLDLSMQDQAVIAHKDDGSDHTILILDGPAFRNYLPTVDLLNVPRPVAGDSVYTYGDGEGQYPAARKDGVVDEARQLADLSDMDKRLGLTYYTLHIVRGDSGSAVYDRLGRVVGLVSWGIDQEEDSASEASADFTLAFTERDLLLAHNYQGMRWKKNLW